MSLYLVLKRLFSVVSCITYVKKEICFFASELSRVRDWWY